MTVRIEKPAINVREELADLRKPTGIAGEAMLRAETPQEQFNLIGAGRRNLIINGAMQVAQRGTSVTGATSAGYSTVDRLNHNSSGGTLDMSRQDFALGQTDVPSQFKHYFRMNATTGANNAGLRYRVEDVQSVPEGSVTLSFYAKGTNPNGGNFELDPLQFFGSGGSTTVALSAETLTVSSSWQRFTYTLAVPSISGKTVGSGNYFQIYWKQPNGDNSTNAWTLDITGVQLEVGKVATPFEHRSYGEELAVCQRYTFVVNGDADDGIGFGTAKTSTQAILYVNFPCVMRSNPSLVVDNPQIRVDSLGTLQSNTVDGSLQISNSTAAGAHIKAEGFSGLNSSMSFPAKMVSGAITFDAEL